MDQALRQTGLLWRVLGAWADLRASMRAELDHGPSEGRLLFYVVLSGLIWFIGRVAVLAAGPLGPTIPEDEFAAMVGAEFLSAFFYRTLAFYVVAAFAGWIARLAGGRGTWRDSRAAMFWAALVAAPAILAATLFSLLLTGAPGLVAPIAGMLGAVAFGWAAANCIAEVHGFASVWRVLAAIAGFAAALVAGVYLVGHL